MALTFDANYYLQQRPDVFQAYVAAGGEAGTGVQWSQFAEQHYNTYGWAEFSNPNETFNTREYLLANPDVAAAGINPFQHYLSFGVNEGRAPSATFVKFADFDSAKYLAANPDLAAAGIDTPNEAYAHYVVYGQYENRPGGPVNEQVGQTYTLKADQDIFNGGNGNDVIRGVAGVPVGGQDQSTLNSSDFLDGGLGDDKLVINMTGNAYNGGATIKGIETIQIGTNVLGGVAFDYNVNAGEYEITGANTLIYDQINNGEALAINNITPTAAGNITPTLEWANEAGSRAGGIVATYRQASVSGATDTQNVTLKNINSMNAGDGTLDIGGGMETVSIKSTGTVAYNTLNNSNNADTGANAVAADIISAGSLGKVILTGDVAIGKEAGVVANGPSQGLTDRLVGVDTGLTPDATANATESNLLSVGSRVTTVDASEMTASANVRFVAKADASATNVTFLGGHGNDYVEFELGNVSTTGGEGNDTFAFINAGANSTFGEGDSINGGEGSDTIQLGLNGVGTYNISETELRNKVSVGTLDLRGNVNNLTVSSDFVAQADTAGTVTVRTDKIIQTSGTDSSNPVDAANNGAGLPNGQENAATSTINLTKLSSSQGVEFLGGSGSDRLILNDATFNVLQKLDGGVYNDTAVIGAGSNRYDTITVTTSGENVVIDAQDLSSVKNFEGFTLTKNAANATYNVTLTKAFLNANTQATDNANTAINDTIFQIGTANAANNSALGAGDTVTIDIRDLLNAGDNARSAGYAGRTFDVTSLENAGVNIVLVGNGGNVTLAQARLAGVIVANGADANWADVVVSSAANASNAPILAFQGTNADETYTLQANSDSVNMGGGNDTLNIPAAFNTPTGNLAGGNGTDVINAAAATNLAGATVTGFETLNTNGAISFGANSLLDQFTTVNGAAATADVFNITAGNHTLNAAALTNGANVGIAANDVTYNISAGASLSVAGDAGAANVGVAANAVFTGQGTLITTGNLTLTGASDTISNVTFGGAVSVTDDGAGPAGGRTYTGNAAANTLVYDQVAAAPANAFTFNGFDATDKIDLAGAVTAITGIVTAGATITSGAVGAAKSMAVLSGASFQIAGELTQTGDAGAVEQAILAAQLKDAAFGATEFFYVAIDNGTDTGIYRVTEGAADAGTVGVLDVASDISVTLVGTLKGVADAGVLVGGNFA